MRAEAVEYPTINEAGLAHKGRALRTITLGFSADPVARWIWPEAETYLRWMPKFADAFAGRAFDRQTAYVANAFEAAALWLPPEESSDDAEIDAILEASVRPEIAGDLERLFREMDACHPSDQPCWYLPMIAADPAFLGQGLGAALMKHALVECDRTRTIAYLESSNPRNLSLYRRHGFEVVGLIQCGDSPPMYPMIREPLT